MTFALFVFAIFICTFLQKNDAAFIPHHHRDSCTFLNNFVSKIKLSQDETEGTDIAKATTKKPKPKKKKKFTINPDMVGVSSIASDGILKEKLEEKEARRQQASTVKSKLGVPSKSKKKQETSKTIKPLSAKSIKAQNQRTAGGLIDSTKETMLASLPEEQNLQVQVAKRGAKVVTMVRGMTWPMDERKSLLKELKKKLGGGGTLIDGVLELQGSHSEKVLSFLKSKGFTKAKVIG